MQLINKPSKAQRPRKSRVITNLKIGEITYPMVAVINAAQIKDMIADREFRHQFNEHGAGNEVEEVIDILGNAAMGGLVALEVTEGHVTHLHSVHRYSDLDEDYHGFYLTLGKAVAKFLKGN